MANKKKKSFLEMAAEVDARNNAAADSYDAPSNNETAAGRFLAMAAEQDKRTQALIQHNRSKAIDSDINKAYQAYNNAVGDYYSKANEYYSQKSPYYSKSKEYRASIEEGRYKIRSAADDLESLLQKYEDIIEKKQADQVRSAIREDKINTGRVLVDAERSDVFSSKFKNERQYNLFEQYNGMSATEEEAERARLNNIYRLWSNRGDSEKADAAKEELEFIETYGSVGSRIAGAQRKGADLAKQIADIDEKIKENRDAAKKSIHGVPTRRGGGVKRDTEFQNEYEALLKQRKELLSEQEKYQEMISGKDDYSSVLEDKYNALSDQDQRERLKDLQSRKAYLEKEYAAESEKQKGKYFISDPDAAFSPMSEEAPNDEKYSQIKAELDSVNSELKYLYRYGSDESQYLGRLAGREDLERRIAEAENKVIPARERFRLEGTSDAHEALVKAEEEADALKNELNMYLRSDTGKSDKYWELRNSEDFDINSSAPVNNNPSFSDVLRNEAKSDIISDPLAFAIDNKAVYDGFASRGESYLNAAEALMQDLQNSEYVNLRADWSFLEEDEKKTYYYILNNQGLSAASEYLRDMEVIVNRRENEEQARAMYEELNRGGVSGAASAVALSAGAVINSVYGSAFGALDDAMQGIEVALGVREDFNPYSGGNASRLWAQNAKNAVSQKIAEDIPFELFEKNIPAFIYNTLMSSAESVVGATTLGGLYTVAMGSSAAATQAQELYEKGATGTQMFLGSLTAGVAEALFEYISIENLLSEKNISSIGRWVKETLKQSGVEASEEMLTDIANFISDNVVMGLSSDYELKKREYIEKGYSDTEATKKALLDNVGETVWSGLAGALSGGVTAAMFNTIQAKENYSEGRKIIKSGRENELLDSAKALKLYEDVANEYNADPRKVAKGTREAIEIADKLVSQLNNRGKISPMALGALQNAINQGIFNSYNDITDAMTSVERIQRDLESRGVKPTEAKRQAEIISKTARGETVRAKEREEVENSEAAKEVFDETKKAVENVNIITNYYLEYTNRDSQNPMGEKRLDRAFEEPEHLEVSENGKTVLKSTGDEITPRFVDTESGGVAVSLDGEKAVSMSDISWGSNREALIFETLASEGAGADVLNKLVGIDYGGISASDGITTQVLKTAYIYGASGVSEDFMRSREEIVSRLPESIVHEVYKAARAEAKAKSAKADTVVKSRRIGKVVRSGGIEYRSDEYTRRAVSKIEREMNSSDSDTRDKARLQSESVKVAKYIAEIIGTKVVFFASEAGANGKRYYIDENGNRVRCTFNGAYLGDGTLLIDINSGRLGEGTIAYTLSHELAHFIKEWSPAKFTMLQEILLNEYAARGKSIQELIDERISYEKLNGGRNISRDTALEEIVADACESFILDENVVKTLQKIKAKDKGLFAKIKQFFEDLFPIIGKLKALYDGKSNSAYGAEIKGWSDALERIHKAFAEGLGEASENFVHSEQKKNTDDGVKYQERESAYTEYDKPITAEDINVLRSIGRKSINAFTSADIQASQKWAHKFYKELGTKSPFFRAWFGDWRVHDTSPVAVLDMKRTEGKNPRGVFVNKDTGWSINSSSVGYDETVSHAGRDKISIRAVQNIDKIIEEAILLDTEVSEYGRGKKGKNTAFIHKFYSPIKVDKTAYIAKLAVEESHQQNHDTLKKFYHVRAIEISPASSVGTGFNQIAHLLNAGDISTVSISDLFTLVKQYDKDFSAGKAVNPVLLNEDGTPKVFYHGTNESFTAFSQDEFGLREGSYFFAENREDAAAYGDNVMPVYLRAENLADYDNQESKFYKLKDKKSQVNYLKQSGYDGWYADMDSGGWGEISVFSPEQIKSATDNIGTFDKSDPDIRFSTRYSYDDLVSKPDMKVTTLTAQVPSNRSDIVTLAKNNAAKIGKRNADGSVSVYVEDAKADVVLGTRGLLHGLDRRVNNNALVTVQAGEILKNAIKINELTPKKAEVDSSYVMIGAAKDAENIYFVRFVINKHSSEMISMDVLYALNAKSTAVLNAPLVSRLDYRTTISISHLLENVNRYFPDILSESVLRHFGYTERPEGELGKSALYSTREQPAYSEMAEMKALQRENEKLRDDVEGLEQLIKLQKQMTGGKVMTQRSAEIAANNIAKKYGITMNKQNRAELTNQMSAAFTGIASLGESAHLSSNSSLMWEDVQNVIYPVASWIAEHSRDMTLDPDALGVEASASEKAEIAEFMGAQLAGAVTQDVYDAYWKASRLETVADKYQTKMNKLMSEHIKAMSELRKEKNLQADKKLSDQADYYRDIIYRVNQDKSKLLDKRLADQAAYYQDMLSRLRKAKNDRIDQIKKSTTESRKRDIERRLQTQMRHRIEKLHHNLDQMLRNPTDNNYIPIGLISAAIDTLEAIDGRNGEVNKIHAALSNLYSKYEKLKLDTDIDYKDEYDEFLAFEIDELENLMQGTDIYDKEKMSLDTLGKIYEVIRSIYGTMKDAKKQIGEAEGITIHESGMRIINEQNKIRRRDKNVMLKAINTVDDASSLFYLNSLRSVLKMCDFNEDAELYKLFTQINVGLRKGYDWQMKVSKKLDALVLSKEGQTAYEKAQSEIIDYGFARMTKMQAMQLLMTIERELAIGTKHIDVGGVSITDSKYRNNIEKARKNARLLRVNSSQIYVTLKQALAGDIWAQKYMKTAREIFDVDSKDALNETSLVLKHRLIATGNHFIPFVTNDSFTVRELTDLVYDATIAGRGSFKAVQKGAKNNLYIEGLDVVLQRCIKNTSDYYGLAVPIRNISKTLNVKSDIDAESVRESIKKNWTSQGLKVIEQTLTDLQTPRRLDQIAIINTLKNAFISSTLNGNISVAIKQAASLDTAFAVLDYRPSAVAWAEFIKTAANYNEIISEIDEHTSQHWRRRIGLSSDEVASIARDSGIIGKINRKTPAVINGNKWIQTIDCLTTATYWNMAKQDVEKHTDFKKGSEEYWNAVTELYNKTIEETQPMYDTLHRSEMQKNNAVNKVLMFKTQPLQNAGLLYTATRSYANAVATGDKAKINKTGKTLLKTVISQARSAITFAMMSALAYAIKGKMGRYKDDEDDELTVVSLLKRLGLDIAGTATGLVFPIGGQEVFSYIDSIASGESYSKALLSMPTIDFFNEIIKKIGNVFVDPSAKSVGNLLMKLGDMTGQPVSNYINLGRGIFYNIKDIANGDFGQFVAGDTITSDQKARRLYKAYVRGDFEAIQRYYKDFKNADAMHRALRQQLREQDNRIKEAAKLMYEGKVSASKALQQEIIDEGHFTQNDVVKATEAEYNAMKNADAKAKEEEEIAKQKENGTYKEWYEREGEEDEEEESSMYSAADLNRALGGNDLTAVKDAITALKTAKMASGKTEKEAVSEIKQSVKAYWKPLYIKACNERNADEKARILSRLESTGLFGSSSSVVAEADRWTK